MAQYFKDFGDNLRSGYHQLKKNKALKGIDDYFDKINAGGGEGLADFAVDMSGIADMYQVGKQGAHIADDLFREGKSWDEVDQGRKDAFERGAVGTALTLAPLPGIKTLGTAGKYATKGLTTTGRNVPGKALVGSGLPKVDKMRRRLEKAHKKAGTSLAPGLSDKAVGKTYRKFKDIPNEDGLRAAYSKLGGNADIIAPGIGKTRRAIRALGGVPLTKGWRSKFPQRAAAVAMKDWDWGEHPSGLNPFYRGEYAGQGANDTDVMEQIMGGAFPGQQGGLGKQGQEGTDGMGMSMNDYMEMGIDDPKLGEAISGGSLQAAAAAERLADIAQPDMPATSTSKPTNSKPASLKDPAPTSVESGAPVFDPRTNEFVRAESLTAEEREAFAGATAAAMKNLDPFNRVQTHDKKGNLRGPGSNWRQQLQRQIDQEKSLKKVQDGYRRDDDMLEIMRARGISGDGGFRGEPGELGRVPTGPGVEDFRRRNIESSRLPKGYSSSANKGLSDMDIHKAISAHKVAMSNAERPPLTSEEMLNEEDNPFGFEKARAQEARDFEELYESGAFEDDMSEPVGGRQPIDGGTRSIYDNWPTVPEDHSTTDYVDPSKGPGPRLSDIDTDTTDYADPNEPRPDPDAEAEQWNRENPPVEPEQSDTPGPGGGFVPPFSAGQDALGTLQDGTGSSNEFSESDNEMREMDALWNTRDAWSPEADADWEQAKQDKYFEENRHKPYDDFVDESGPTSDHPRWNQERGAALKPTGWTPTEAEREYDHGFPSHSTPSTNGTSTKIRNLNDPTGGGEPSIEDLIRELESDGGLDAPINLEYDDATDAPPTESPLGIPSANAPLPAEGEELERLTRALEDSGDFPPIPPIVPENFKRRPQEPPPFWHDENPGATEEGLFDRQELPYEEIQKLSPEDRKRYYKYRSAPAGSVLQKKKLLKTIAERNEELKRHPGLSEFLRR